MKEIELTQGKVARVDDEDYEWLNQWKWYAVKYRNTHYAVRTIWNGSKNPKNNILMHNQILGIKGVDHVNGSGIDNRRHNLRPATPSQNGMNSQKQKNTSSVYKGVCLAICNNGKNQYWKARIMKNGKNLHLGLFKSETAAAFAYNAKATELFGEFARLNEV